MRIAVAGGTGLVGRYVVDALGRAGHEPVVLARARGVDLVSGAGLDDALVGVGAVIDVGNVTTTRKRPAAAYFTASTTRLLAAGRRAGVGHHVALSIVGVDRVDFGYYLGKRRQEELVLAAGTPSSVLRATQFHEFAGQVLDRARGPVAVVPRMTVQPVAASEVAEALVALAAGPAVGMAPELAGPQREELVDLARRVQWTRGGAGGRRQRLLAVRLPGAAGRAMAGGALLPTGPGPRGQQTFTEWLAAAEEPPAAA
ncbi:SDR family oxidoreductase [Streptacidiphilus sp. N1-3]|uniref:SDR family oxidoreductase n=1 Tax=Streptacidiphilus alkalitolerans TaxID=3342712 RepID=A0ABV6X4N2_9ACTN